MQRVYIKSLIQIPGKPSKRNTAKETVEKSGPKSNRAPQSINPQKPSTSAVPKNAESSSDHTTKNVKKKKVFLYEIDCKRVSDSINVLELVCAHSFICIILFNNLNFC